MAACSYLTLSRFDKDPSPERRQRAKSVDDIRDRIRHQLMRARLQIRVKMLHNNRRSLCSYDDDDDHYGQFSQQPLNDQDTLDNISNPAWHSDYDEEDSNPWSFPCESPSTSSCPSPTPLEMLVTPTASPASTSSSATRQRRQLTPRSYTGQYKACQTSSRSTPSPRFTSNQQQTVSEFISFKTAIGRLGSTNDGQEHICVMVNDGWKILINASQSINEEIQYEAVNLLSTLVNERLLLPQTVVNLLQHGLVYNLVDCAFSIQGGFVTIANLFTVIARTMQQVIPYMIEIISTSKMLTYFEEILSTGSSSELEAVLAFYCSVTETMLNQLCTSQTPPPQPQLPDILIKTGISRETLEFYGPVATLIRCLTPVMINNIVTKCLSRHKLSEGDTITNSLILLANTLKLIHVVSNYHLEVYETSIVNLLTAFCQSNIEQNLANLIRGSERLIKTSQSSEHSSQGMGVDEMGSTNLKHCNHFVQFYQQCFGPLYCKYSYMIEEERFPESPKSVMDAW